MSYIRSNAWNNGGTFDNPHLLWYAKGVAEMQKRALNDPNSWWFFAAIHGEYVSNPQTRYPDWAYIPPVPAVPTAPLPSNSEQDIYWNQCQHQSWYFPPWHRGYLIALEAQIREAVVAANGPSDWALPYWDYLGPGDEYKMPPAFAEETLPDGSVNPLFVTARFGPLGDGNIFVRSPPVSDDCMSNTIYTGSNAVTPRPGFGGPETTFNHGGGSNGNLEDNPHNYVHNEVGGYSPQDGIDGLMADPGTAALDPIFYLHHCNIDRMWAAWNDLGNSNPTDSAWLNGPAAIGEREFIMPMPGNTSWVFTPADVNSLDQLDYTYAYDGIAAVQPALAANAFTRRLARLGAAPVADTAEAGMDSTSELVGTHDGALRLESKGIRTVVRLDSGIRRKMTATLEAASATNLPDRAYLRLENVRGNRDANILNVYINGHPVGGTALFGLRRASLKDGEHGGSGLTLELDITEVIDTLHLENALDTDELDVRITPDHAIPADADMSIGRISVYREGRQ